MVADQPSVSHSHTAAALRLPWHRAATLAERLEVGEPVETDLTRGEKRLGMWLEVGSLAGDRSTLDERLAPLGFNSDQLLMLLGEPDSSLAGRLNDEPEWHRSFVRWWTAGRDADAKERLVGPGLELLEAARHLMEGAATELAAKTRARLRALSAPGPVLDDEHNVVDMLLATMPFGEVRNYSLRAMVLELNVARVEGRLAGDTPEQRYASFMAELGDEKAAVAIWQEYPVLARLVVDRLRFWIETRTEFLDALISDVDDLTKCGVLKRPPQRLEQLEFGQGDSHRRGRSVCVVTFDTGRAVFKPRPPAMDTAFDGLLKWVDAQSLAHRLRRIALLDRGTHGWSEYVESEPTTPEGGDRYAWRLGSLTALLYALHATDFHFENAIAGGEHPLLVDLEALLHTDKTSAVLKVDGVEDIAAKTLMSSVHSVGVLPNPMLMRDADEGLRDIDISVLAGRGGQMSLKAGPKWEAEGTDTMHLVKRRATMEGERNLPTAEDGTEFDLLSRSDFFLEGFQRTYQCLQASRRELLAPDGPLAAFAKTRTRLIARPTYLYGLVLYDSTHPDFGRDGLDRDRALSRLCVGHEGVEHRTQMVQNEIAELWLGDIPSFTIDADTGAVRAGLTGEAIGTRQPPPLTEVQDRIRQLSSEDDSFQEWIIKSSFATTAVGQGESHWPNWLRARESRPATADHFADEAIRVAYRLRQLALRDATAVGWVGLDLVEEKYWRLAPAPVSTYAGIAGIAQALDAVAAVTNDRKVEDLAMLAFDHLATRVKRLTDEFFNAGLSEDQPELPVGAFSDLGGVVYALAHATARHGESAYADTAIGLLPAFDLYVSKDTMLDVLGGIAGAILVMLALERVAPGSGALDIAERCGERLLAERQAFGDGAAWLTAMGDEAPLGGFSHGASGIAVALARLHQHRPRPDYIRAIQEGLRYEAGLYDEEQRNWRDLRPTESGGGREQDLVAWCHGAAGIALARHDLLEMATVVDAAAELEEDRHRAVLTTFATGLDRDPVSGIGTHSLCHGDVGNLLIVQKALRPDREPDVAELLPRVWRTLLVEGRSNGWICGVPNGIETPGLMTGLAGIAWGLARMASTAPVPDILSVDPPAMADLSHGTN